MPQRKLAAGYQKALDKADQLMGQMGESSKATVSFDQSLRDTTKSLTELANAVPNEFHHSGDDRTKPSHASLTWRTRATTIARCSTAATSSR
ncbi:hypothetical protein S96127_4311 (plasmid) [Yersinia pestis]|uniref:hypothetical protein n=1 Tax=Yersinia pestis TaxID=632 RepID=UPI0018A59AB1|nr:hypothetical protein S96127_4311 [Yersinia pestis]